MFVKYQINSSIFASGTTASTINIPITMDYQIVDNGELIERVFVNTEVQKRGRINRTGQVNWYCKSNNI